MFKLPFHKHPQRLGMEGVEPLSACSQVMNKKIAVTAKFLGQEMPAI